MNQLRNQTVIGFLLPIISALIVLFTPDYDPFFAVVTLVAYILLLMLPIFLHFKYKNRRKKDIVYLLTLKYILYLFLLYFTFPLLKIFSGNLPIQIVLIALFIAIPYLARYDQNTEVPIIYPGADKKHKKIHYVYEAIPFILVIAGGGGNIIISRQLTEILGYSTAMMMFSIVLYLFSCWLLFFFSSLIYKSHVKEGNLHK